MQQANNSSGRQSAKKRSANKSKAGSAKAPALTAPQAQVAAAEVQRRGVVTNALLTLLGVIIVALLPYLAGQKLSSPPPTVNTTQNVRVEVALTQPAQPSPPEAVLPDESNLGSGKDYGTYTSSPKAEAWGSTIVDSSSNAAGKSGVAATPKIKTPKKKAMLGSTPPDYAAAENQRLAKESSEVAEMPTYDTGTTFDYNYTQDQVAPRSKRDPSKQSSKLQDGKYGSWSSTRPAVDRVT